MKKLIITVDGPAASGKGTISKHIKKKFNFYHLDSGLLYRIVAKEIVTKKINFKNNKDLQIFLKKLKKISLKNQSGLRTLTISKLTSEIAKFKKIRDFINFNQKKIVREKLKKFKGIVIDGRDIGSVVFKNAQIKFYIKTNPKIRAKRRYKELIDRGEKSIYDSVLKEIKLRDYKDKNRINSPLVIPKDAVIIDNSKTIKTTKKLIDSFILQKIS